MKKLLSLPPNLVDCFHDITGYDRKEWFCSNDPVGKKLGSGGGTTSAATGLCRRCRRKDLRRMAFCRQTPYPACRRTEPTVACIRPVGKDSDADTRVSMGARTETVARSAIVADTAI